MHHMARNIYACRLSPRLLGTPTVKDFFEKTFRDMERPHKGRYNWASSSRVPSFEQDALVLFFDIDGTSILGEAVFLRKEQLNDKYSAEDSSWCLWFDWKTIHCYGTKVPTSEFETLPGGEKTPRTNDRLYVDETEYKKFVKRYW